MPEFVPAELRGPFYLSVVGESHYQPALEAICGPKTDDGHNVTAEAILILQDDNPYDKNAVQVTIQGQLVGYMSRFDAEQFRKKLQALGNADKQFKCVALIRGGWDRGEGDSGMFGVKLDLDMYKQ